MCLKLYIEIKKSECGFGAYPLIITTLDKSANELLFDGKVDAVRCLENLSEKVAELISYKSNCSASLPLFDMKGNKIISDCKHSDVKVGQIYKDKCTLISAMASYAVEYFFNFYAKRSDKKSYVLRCRLEDYVWIFKDYASEGLDSLSKKMEKKKMMTVAAMAMTLMMLLSANMDTVGIAAQGVNCYDSCNTGCVGIPLFSRTKKMVIESIHYPQVQG
ncbi:putative phospho-2-dehydro-3-deoxyheptonate aldolase 2, chloroplastic-like [Capsicum annuum]|nr:putative phospho-2-dehydro-3-deoxyheptonate aldolase 2, chloroplastic-like [Capsicum annuum]